MKRNRVFILVAVALGTAMMLSCNNDDDGTTDDLTTELVINNYIQIATGQTVTYDDEGNVITGLSPGDDFYGQDAHYLKGATISYTDNGDGTVTDNNTGLMWQQVPSSTDYKWQDGVDYCNDLELAGYDDWRIPSLKELYSISNFSVGWPYLDTSYFDLAGGEVSKDEQYWSSNFYVGVTDDGGANNTAMGVNHGTGHIKGYTATAEGAVGGRYVRAVRGDDYGTNDFVDNGDGTITDLNTGLMWAQDDSQKGYDWEDALAYAESSELAGYTDWRLPNVKELQGIVDYTKSPSATEAENIGPAINNLFSCTPILNEAGNDDYPYYWTSTSALFRRGGEYYYAWYVAFGMAVGPEGEDHHGAGSVRFDTKYEGGEDGEDAARFYNYVRLVRDAN